VGSLLAEEFSKQGAVVTVVTDSLGTDLRSGYPVVRRPSLTTLRRLGREADVIFENNVSLQTLLPLLSVGKPIVVAHQTWLTRTDGSRGWQDHLKRLSIRWCHNVAISQAIADALPVTSVIMPNPFDVREFENFQDIRKSRDIVFMGRLVPDKGCDLLLRSLAKIKSDGIHASLTIIGDGPEVPALRALTAELELSAQVLFLGAMREGRGKEVARHRIMAVPSRWAEPFGIVALEGIACGCALVASSQGGLAEAVGACGLLFPNGDIALMASALKDLLSRPALCDEIVSHGPEHLKRFQPGSIARDYLNFFRCLVRSEARS
jgi:glycogen(starch) synthase